MKRVFHLHRDHTGDKCIASQHRRYGRSTPLSMNLMQ